MKKKLSDYAKVCNLHQMVTVPTRVEVNCNGHKSATCIDHIFTNSKDMCSKAVSVPVGFSDHNLVAVVRKAKVPKAGPKVIVKRSFKSFCQNDFICDINKLQWDNVCAIDDVDEALDLFTSMFLEVAEKHAPIRKFTVRKRKAGWIDDELRALMAQRDQMKSKSIRSGEEKDWMSYRSLRNEVTKINRKKKSMYYQTRINEIKHDGKKLWKTLN